MGHMSFCVALSSFKTSYSQPAPTYSTMLRQTSPHPMDTHVIWPTAGYQVDQPRLPQRRHQQSMDMVSDHCHDQLATEGIAECQSARFERRQCRREEAMGLMGALSAA